MRATTAYLALAVATVSAQSQVQNYTSSLDMEIDSNTVDPSDKSTWCRAQSNTCNNLCDNDVEVNDCGFGDLSYECTCAGNGSAPGLEFYTQTMPTFICDRLFSQCIELNAGDQDGQEACNENIGDLCAKTNPPAASDDDDEDDEDDEEDSATTTTSQRPSETTSSDSEDNVSTTESDGLAAPTAAPRAVGALAAIGLVAAFI